MRVVFIDRDGTMGGGYNIEYPWEYKPFPKTREAFQLLKDHGFVPIIFTNQSCIARGKSGNYNFDKEFAEIGAYDWFICPHDDQDQCECRKPKPGLLFQARDKYNLDLTQCYVIGDRWSDMKAGGVAGCRLILVRTGRGNEALGPDRDKWIEYHPEYVAEDLYDAVCWLGA
jgi:HAD superfamily hydrolase (TIGR01662 family)